MFSKVNDKGQWQALLASAYFKTFFHSIEWEEFLEKEFFWLKFERYIWRNDLILSVARCKFLGKEKTISHPFCEYGGPLPLKSNIDGSDFKKDFSRTFGVQARMRNHPYIRPYIRSYIRPEKGAGQGLASFLIEDFSKKTAGDLWLGFRKTLRQEIRKSDSWGISVEECGSIEELEMFYNLYVETIKRHKNIPLPHSAFSFLYQSSEAEIYLAKMDGKILGGSIFLFYKPFIHYYISATDYNLRKFNIAYAILWHVMQLYVGRPTSHIGYDYFDLGGTRKGSSLETFKRGWGAVEHPIYELGRGSGGEIGGLKRDLWGLLPKEAMKALSPYALFFKL